MVDFPGSAGVEEHHQKAFELFAAINNLLILIIGFEVDVIEPISEMVGEAIKNVLLRVRGRQVAMGGQAKVFG